VFIVLHCISVFLLMSFQFAVEINERKMRNLSCGLYCTVYLRTLPEVCLERVRRRARKEETTLSLVRAVWFLAGNNSEFLHALKRVSKWSLMNNISFRRQVFLGSHVLQY